MEDFNSLNIEGYKYLLKIELVLREFLIQSFSNYYNDINWFESDKIQYLKLNMNQEKVLHFNFI
jgi:hypothetical protein